MTVPCTLAPAIVGFHTASAQLQRMGSFLRSRPLRSGEPLAVRAFLFAALSWFCQTACSAPGPSSWMFGSRWSSLAEPVFRHVDMELAKSGVSSLAQDGDGFLWVGTERGLVRWDGYQSRVLTDDVNDPGALHDPYITALYVDAVGTLWVGTRSRGLARYDGANNRFVSYPVGRAGFAYPTVYAITGDRNGTLWVATGSGDGLGSVDRLDVASGRIQVVDPNPQLDLRARTLLIDHDETLWIGSLTGLIRCARMAPCRNVAIPDAPRVYAVYEDSERTLWIGTARSIYFLSAGATTPQPFDIAEFHWICDIAEPVPGEVWMASQIDGLLIVDVKSKRVRHVHHRRGAPTTLQDDSLSVLLRDRSGLLWIGSASGLVSYDPQSAILTVSSDAIKPNTPGDISVNVLVPSRNGTVWSGTAANGVYSIDPEGTSHPLATHELGSSIYGMAEVAETLFVVADAGLGKVRVDGTGFGRFTLANRRADAPISDIVMHHGKLWLSALDGLWSIDPQAHLNTTAVRAAFSDRLSDQVENAILWETPSRLWVGTRNGLNRVDTEQDTVTQLIARPDDAKSLRSGVIKSLLLDRRGQLWVGTAAGLHRIVSTRAEKPGFERIPLANLREPVDVFSILEARDGSIWVSTTDGLVTIDPATLAARPLLSAEGVINRLSPVNAACVTERGELLFGNLDGLTVVRPDRLQTWNFRPPVIITELRIGGKSIPAPHVDALSQLAPLVIRPDAGGVSIVFAALDFSAPERNRYAYRLDGFDRDWIDSDAHVRTASYAGLPPGDFTLRLRGSNRDGAWSGNEVLVPIRVLPPWYRTVWAFALYVSLFAAALWLTDAWRLRRSARITRLLEKTVAERTAALASANAQLDEARRSAEEATQAKSDFLANMSHEIRTPMNAVLGFAQMGQRQSLPPKTLDYFGKIVAAGRNLLGILNDILDFSKIEAGRLILERVPFDLEQTLDHVRDLFSIKASEKGLEFSVSCDTDVSDQLMGDPLRLNQVLTNLVGNAFKFTQHGYVRLRASVRSRTDDVVVIVFFGRGFGHRHERDSAVPLVCAVFAGRFFDHTTIRRHRPGSDDFTTHRCADGRPHSGRQRARRRQCV